MTDKNITGECNGILHHKVWKLGKMRLVMECDDSQGRGELQHRVWSPSRWTLDAYDPEVIIFLP